MKTSAIDVRVLVVVLAALVFGCEQRSADTPAVSSTADSGESASLADAQVENIVRRSYQYVAMYNVNNKMVMDSNNPTSTGDWNRLSVNATLLDHTMKIIARPNNDTLYATAMLDLRGEPMVLEVPAIDSKYVSLMVTGYDHYVNVPMATRFGDFSEPSRILFYSARTPDYAGEPVAGVDKVFETTGDFVSAVYRVMPHASDPERFERIVESLQQIKLVPLSELDESRQVAEPAPIEFPDFGKTDFDVYQNNFLEVMQFVFNHTTFDESDELDRQLLSAFEPLGVVPGWEFDAAGAVKIDGKRFSQVAREIAQAEMARTSDLEFERRQELAKFEPKGEMELDILLFQSVLGPIGLPAAEAVYRTVQTSDGQPMNATNDYVIRMPADKMPPAGAFWSATLYDTANGFFMPNDRNKYSVGENGGMVLNEAGGIDIYLAAEQPAGVPQENWLPVARGDYAMDVILRVYVPDFDRLESWQMPVAEVISR